MTAFKSPETEAFCRQLQSLLERVYACLAGLNETQLNWQPPIPKSNSLFVIATHTLANARAWVLGIACGQPVQRDRPAEFQARGRDAAGLAAAAQRLSHEMVLALAALAPPDLDRRVLPPKSLWGEGEPRELSVRQALLEVVEHASIHLGQLQVTRDWVLAAGKE